MSNFDFAEDRDGNYRRMINGKTFHYSGAALGEEQTAFLLNRFFGAFQSVPDCNVYDMSNAIAKVLFENGIFISVPDEYPIMAMYAKIIHEYENDDKP